MNTSTRKYLSKSRILSGRQCEKRLWLEVNRPDLLEYDDRTMQAFSTGHRVNEVARSRYPGGVLIGYGAGTTAALTETRRRLAGETDTVLFEAAFKAGNVLVRSDILLRARGGFSLIEVKSATGVKPVHEEDCAVQGWVLDQAGLRVREILLCHIDSRFLYPGNHDYEGLFGHVALTREVRALQREVGRWVKRFKRVLAGAEPRVDMGPHCQAPYTCPFIGYCTGPQPDYPLEILPRGHGVIAALKAEGIQDIRQIPDGCLKNETQERVRQVTRSGRAEIKPGARTILSSLPYPRYYLDFETVSFAVPIWAGTRPYQALPFQWSCHIQETAKKRIRHAEFLDCSGRPPMRRFTESLLDTLGGHGPVLVYSGYEKRILNQLAEGFPDLAGDIAKVIVRLMDLLPIVRDNYYHPDMRGSWSIKAVLPTVSPDLDYTALGEVQHGGAAQDAFLRILDPATPETEKQKLQRDLSAYCKLDTLALVELVRFFTSRKRTH